MYFMYMHNYMYSRKCILVSEWPVLVVEYNKKGIEGIWLYVKFHVLDQKYVRFDPNQSENGRYNLNSI